MATVAAPGTIKKETIYTELVAPDAASQRGSKRKWPPLWDFIKGVSQKDWAEHNVELRLYRYHPQTEKKIIVDKIYEPIDDYWVMKKYGGDHWNMMVSLNSELIISEDFWTDGPRKTAEEIGAAQPAVNGNSSVEMMRMALNPEFMRGILTMFMTAATESMQMIRNQMPPAQNPLETLKTAKEILAPAAPAGNSLLDAIHLLKEIGVVGSPEKKGINELLDIVNTLKGAGLIGGATKPDLTTSLVSNLPVIADRFVAGIHELRLEAESKERVMRLERGQMRPTDPNVITVNPHAPQPAAASQAPAQGAADARDAKAPPAAPVIPDTLSAEVTAQVIMQADLQRLVAAMKAPDCTGRDIYQFLWMIWPAALEEFAKFDAKTMLIFFQSREMQMARLGNAILFEMAEDPRLPRLIEEFLAVAKAEAAPPPTTTV